MANAEYSIHTDDGQKKNTAEHVGILEETIELAEKESKRPVVIEKLFEERSYTGKTEDQVCYGEIDKPYASDIGLQTHASHQDDHRVPSDAEDNGNGVEDNGNIIHNGINVHCNFFVVGCDV